MRERSKLYAIALVSAAAALFAARPVAAIPATQATSPPATVPAKHPVHKHTKAKPSPAKTAAQAAPAPAIPAALPPPNWPMNDKPVQASVVWDSHGLRIDAANSSLEQILRDVSADTGAKVEGLGSDGRSDQRIYGTYGPGPARDVLSQLLDGSGYNVLMIGDQGEGTPRQIVLSAQPTGPAPPSHDNGQNESYEEQSEMEQQQPEPQPGPPNFRYGAPPPMPQRTPQEVIQELRERQGQMPPPPNNQ